MKLYLVRHGEAKSAREYTHSSLTGQGKEGVERVAEAAKEFGVKPLRILHSGKLRAEQTAGIIADTLGLSERVEAATGLNPNDDVHPWAGEISMETDDLMLVGHLPFIDRLTSLIVCNNEDVGVVLFSCGTMVCLEDMEDKRWIVQWILKPFY